MLNTNKIHYIQAGKPLRKKIKTENVQENKNFHD